MFASAKRRAKAPHLMNSAKWWRLVDLFGTWNDCLQGIFAQLLAFGNESLYVRLMKPVAVSRQ